MIHKYANWNIVFTASCSTAELSRNIFFLKKKFFVEEQEKYIRKKIERQGYARLADVLICLTLMNMYLHVKTFPGFKKSHVDQIDETHFKVYVREPAQHGMANTAMIRELANHLQIRSERLRIIKGHRSPSKLVEFR